jgi:PilZ domain
MAVEEIHPGASDQGEAKQGEAKGIDWRERRGHPRHLVDCRMTVSSLTGAIEMPGRLVELSAGGCRVKTDQRFLAGILVRVEVQFQLRGIAFRLNGVTQGGRNSKSFAVRFVDISSRKRAELAEVLAEVESENATAAPPAAAPPP